MYSQLQLLHPDIAEIFRINIIMMQEEKNSDKGKIFLSRQKYREK